MTPRLGSGSFRGHLLFTLPLPLDNGAADENDVGGAGGPPPQKGSKKERNNRGASGGCTTLCQGDTMIRIWECMYIRIDT